MPSERAQRRIDSLLDEAEAAVVDRDWATVRARVESVLTLDPDNEDAQFYRDAAERGLSSGAGDSADRDGGGENPPVSAAASPASSSAGTSVSSTAASPAPSAASAADVGDSATSSPSVSASAVPASFSGGRYVVEGLLGEGGKKRVYLARDETLDRRVAFALIKTEGLDETSRERVRREAQAMGRLGNHPNVVPIYDLGEEVVTGSGGPGGGEVRQPYMVQPLMAGGDVEGLIEEAEGPLELETALRIATQTAEGLSFAHSKGIVHRDLKPGNVWLDEDGTAKIGDFGLAVTTDRSRLTTEKVMVGTVSYMPPEQATGVDVTPAADLYSLGAMLYEMCTGRVPFIADDDIGIISQHINTPPVAPSWHNRLVPKALDALVMRLLAKDPSERPASAEEVVSALGAVDLSAVPDEEDEKGTGSLDSMAGGVFVGRQREMDQLKSIFEDALGGRGRLVTLVGEPGIGKTRTAQELATYSSMRGAKVLWGRSYEGGGAPPYWPWVQAIRSHVTDTEETLLRSQMGTAASVIYEVVPEVKQTLPEVQPPPPIEDPESARFRLFDSITTFLKNASGNAPLVVMLEDLHWADRPSLSLLEFVARELGDSRLLIVGNYRDVELNRRHPLSMTLGELGRERLFDRVVLRGLARAEIERFIEVAAGTEAPEQLITTVYEHTEGNPLFMTETVRLLVQEGEIASGQARNRGTTSWELKIPEGVREVIGRRLDKLSERCNELLSTAAVIGRQFRFDVLLKLEEELTENSLLDLMDEALGARVVEELPGEIGHYQFSHALIEETLSDELSLTRKVRLHARIAQTLEDYYGSSATAHAEQLAHHFAQAETITGKQPVIKYSLIAGETALERLANEDAFRHFATAWSAKNEADFDQMEQERKILGIITSADEESADIHSGLARAHARMSREEQSFAYFITALQYYLDNKLIEKLGALGSYPLSVYPREYMRLIKQAVPMMPEGSLIQGRLYSRSSMEGTPAESQEAASKALQIARKFDDTDLLGWIVGRAAMNRFWGDDFDQARDYLNQSFEVIDRVNDLQLKVHVEHWAAALDMMSGESRSAREHASKGVEYAIRSKIPFRIGLARQVSMPCAWMTGDWPQLIGDYSYYAEDSNMPPHIAALHAYYCANTGEIDEAADSIEKIGAFLRREPAPRIQLLYALASCLLISRIDPEQWNLEEIKALWKDGEPFTDFSPMISGRYGDLTRSLIAIAEGDSEAAAELYERCSRATGQMFVALFCPPIQTDHLMALLAVTAGLHDEARSSFEKAIEFCSSAEYLPELAWTQAEYSEFLLELGEAADREKAAALQGEAISIARDLSMKPLLERVLAGREIMTS